MSPYGNHALSQIDLLADAEAQIATARAAMAASATATTDKIIISALSRASFLIWAVSQERADPTAPDAVTPAYQVSAPVPVQERTR
jgi:hypothetical protein